LAANFACGAILAAAAESNGRSDAASPREPFSQ
jgi:hypothetical protein